MNYESTWRRWQGDAKRGVRQVRAAATAAVDAVFLTGETLPLRMRLHHVDRQLAAAYQALGSRVADQWTASALTQAGEKPFQADAQALPLFLQIESLREERRHITSEISAAGETSDK